MKFARLLVVSILVMVFTSGCSSGQVADDTGGVSFTAETERTDIMDVDEKYDLEYDLIGENAGSEYIVYDELFKKHQHDVGFVAVKLPAPDYIQEYFDEEGEGTYYEYYEIGDTSAYSWIDIEFIELPSALQVGEFAYVKADATFIAGGIDGRTNLEFEEIKECRKISLEEAASLIGITDLYECEKQYVAGFGGLARHSQMNDYLMVGGLENRYDYPEDRENAFYGEVTVYLKSEGIGHFNRLEFVGDYLVFFNHEGNWKETELPENITIENIEELLATGKQYNDVMFVLHQREEDTGDDSEASSFDSTGD